MDRTAFYDLGTHAGILPSTCKERDNIANLILGSETKTYFAEKLHAQSEVGVFPTIGMHQTADTNAIVMNDEIICGWSASSPCRQWWGGELPEEMGRELNTQ